MMRKHSIIARRGQPLRWLNELLGHVSLIPFANTFPLFTPHTYGNIITTRMIQTLTLTMMCTQAIG